MMDEEVRELVAEAYQRTLELMEAKKEQVGLVAEFLLKQETISHTDVAKLIGER
jgi:AFG3 family protein